MRVILRFITYLGLDEMSQVNQQLLERYMKVHSKTVKASEREGWHEGYTYRANIDLSTLKEEFALNNQHCEICGEFHIVPYEGDPNYIRENRPLEIAKNWATKHHLVAYVERRPGSYHHELGKRSTFPGTYVDKVEGYGEWELYKKVMPSGKIVRIDQS